MNYVKVKLLDLIGFIVPAKIPTLAEYDSLEVTGTRRKLRSLSAAEVSRSDYDDDTSSEGSGSSRNKVPKSRLQLIAERTIKLRRLKYTPLFIAFLIAATYPPTREILTVNISELYIDVATFVAFTLLVIYALEVKYKIDVGAVSNKYKYLQVPLSTFLGALPGCGGAIVVASKYSKGKISFGSLVATLVATMGDAAYLLISKEPKTALIVLTIQMIAGIITGYIVDIFVKKNFINTKKATVISQKFDMNIIHKITPFLKKLWMLILIPGLFFAIINTLNIDTVSIQVFSKITLYDLIFYLGLFGGLLSLVMWFLFPFFIFDHSGNLMIKPDAAMATKSSIGEKRLATINIDHSVQKSDDISYIKDTTNQNVENTSLSDVLKSNLVIRIISDCNFIYFWVLLATLIFEYFMLFANIDLSTIFHSYAYAAIAFAILIGFIPGCGAQIIVTSLYLSGIIPLAAQIGNAISNDGDALFPVLALAPKAAIYATLYSMIPALLVSFAWQYFFG